MLAPLLRRLVFLLQGHTAVSGRLGERGRPRAPGGSGTSLPFFFFFFFSFAGGLPSLSAEERQRQCPGPKPGPPWAWQGTAAWVKPGVGKSGLSQGPWVPSVSTAQNQHLALQPLPWVWAGPGPLLQTDVLSSLLWGRGRPREAPGRFLGSSGPDWDDARSRQPETVGPHGPTDQALSLRKARKAGQDRGPEALPPTARACKGLPWAAGQVPGELGGGQRTAGPRRAGLGTGLPALWGPACRPCAPAPELWVQGEGEVSWRLAGGGRPNAATLLTAVLAARLFQPQPEEIRVVLQSEGGGQGFGGCRGLHGASVLIGQVGEVLSHRELALDREQAGQPQTLASPWLSRDPQGLPLPPQARGPAVTMACVWQL